MNRYLLTVFLAMIFLPTTLSQAQGLDFNDRLEIYRKADFMLRRYQSLLRLLSDARRSNEQARIEKKIASSFDPETPQRLFLSDQIIIENDLVPRAADPKADRDVQLSEYLRKFNLEYVKQPKASIFLTQTAVGNLNEGDELYLQILFQRKYDSHHTVYPKVPYEELARLVELRPIKKEGRWELYISGVRYATPEQIAKIEAETKGRELCAQAILRAKAAAEIRDFFKAEELLKYVNDNGCSTPESEKQTDLVKQKLAQYHAYLIQGDESLENGALDISRAFFQQAKAVVPRSTEAQLRLIRVEDLLVQVDEEVRQGERLASEGKYQLALQHLQKALRLHPTADALERRIKEVEFDSREERYRQLLGEADLAYQVRDYRKAQNSYEQAAALRPREAYPQQQLNQIARIVGPLVTAEATYDNGDFDEAIKLFKDIETKNPQAPEPKEGIARCYHQKYLQDPRERYLDEARESIDEALALSPRYANAVQLSAQIYETQKDYAKAIEAYTTLQVFDTSSTVYHYKIGQMHEQMGDYQTARKSYQKAIVDVDDATAAEIHVQMGKLLLYRLRRTDSAYQAFEAAINRDSSKAEPFYMCALTALGNGEHQLAATNYQKAALRGLARDSIKSWRNRVGKIFTQGRVQFGYKQYKAAVYKLEQVVALDPRNSAAWFWKGQAHYEQAQHALAVDCYSTAIALNPAYYEAYYKRGLAYKAQPNSGQRALEDFTHVISQHRADTAQCFAERGDVYFALGSENEFPTIAREYYLKALSDYLNAVEGYPVKAEIEHKLSKLYYRMEKYDYALEYANKAIKHNSDMAEAYYFRGLTYLKTNQLSKAQSDFKKATQERKSYSLAQLGLAMSQLAYRHAKDLKKAIFMLETARNGFNRDGFQPEIGGMSVNEAKATASFYRAYAQYLFMRLYPSQSDSRISWNNALNDCETAALYGRGNVEIMNDIMTLKGLIILSNGQLSETEKAAESFKRILAETPEDSWAKYGLAACKLVEGETSHTVLPMLEEAFEKKEISWLEISQDPWLKNIKSSAGFRKLRRQYLAPMTGPLGSLLNNN
ncbi:MAG: tetratricopeptide repeat protein [Bacteroidota bacterium]